MSPRRVLLLAAVLVPQGGPPATLPALPADLEALAAEVGRAHGSLAIAEPAAFQARIVLTPLGRTQDTVMVTLDASYLTRAETTPLIRYAVDEQGRKIERGLDAKGPWARNDKAVYALQGKDYAEEATKLRRDLGLARQLLHFVRPHALLLALRQAGVPEAQDLPRIGRLPPQPCITVRGRLDDFPFHQARGEAGPAEVRVWIDRSTRRLAAVQATPLDDSGRPSGKVAELVLLREFQPRSTLLLPTELVVYERVGVESLKAVARVQVQGLDLAPKLAAKDLERPARG